MESKISRRKFVLAASSLGSAMMADGLSVLDKTGGGTSHALLLGSGEDCARCQARFASIFFAIFERKRHPCLCSVLSA